MTKQIVGAYKTEAEAINTVDSLELQGLKSKNIAILTNSNTKELKSRTDVKVVSSEPHLPETSFMGKIKKTFMKQQNQDLDFHEKLIHLGLSKELVTRCIADIESGMVLVIADNELKMGHAPPVGS